MDAPTTLKYQAKAKSSFTTKLNLYLFDKAIRNDWESINLDNFNSFIIIHELVDIYTTEYFQNNTTDLINGLTIDSIYKKIVSKEKELAPLINLLRDDYIHLQFKKVFPENEFENLLEHKTCTYCGISEQEIKILANNKQLRKKSLRGWTLEIDRRDSNFEYNKDNCIMACYWCNNAKTDEFTENEFKEIGKEIRKVWESRLGLQLNQ